MDPHEHSFLKIKLSKGVIETRYESFMRLHEVMHMTPSTMHDTITNFFEKHYGSNMHHSSCIYGFDGRNTDPEVFVSDSQGNTFGLDLSTADVCTYLRTPKDCYSELIAILNTVIPEDMLQICNSFQPMDSAKHILAKDCNNSSSSICNIYVVLNHDIDLDIPVCEDLVRFLTHRNSLHEEEVMRLLLTCRKNEKYIYRLHEYGFEIKIGRNGCYEYDLKILLKSQLR